MISKALVISAGCESPARGAIHNLEEYLRAKMITHDRWGGVLPRHSTPMDIDMMLDNRGCQMYVELSRYSADWDDLPNGQHESYRKAVCVGRGMHVGVIARHVTPPDHPIDSYGDVVEFTVMRYDPDAPPACRENLVYERHEGNEAWVRFVVQWMS